MQLTTQVIILKQIVAGINVVLGMNVINWLEGITLEIKPATTEWTTELLVHIKHKQCWRCSPGGDYVLCKSMDVTTRHIRLMITHLPWLVNLVWLVCNVDQ